MRTSLNWLNSSLVAVIALGGIAVSSGHGAVFTDDFEADHDFKANGVAGTGWDQLSDGSSGDAVLNTMDTTTFDGELTINSTRSGFESGRDDLATLTRTVPADTPFRAIVEMSRNSDFPGDSMNNPPDNVSFHNAGLIARPESQPNGSDWVGIKVFRQFFSDYLFRSMQNDAENVADGDISEPFPDGVDTSERLPDYLRLDRLGTTYRAFFSSDGENWTQIEGWREGQPDAFDRPDHVGRTMQVGLMQGTFADNSLDAVFDDFQLITGKDVPEPASVSLLALGGLVLGTRRRRR